MKIRLLAVLIFALSPLAIAAQVAPQSSPLGWEDCFKAAMDRSETISDQDELIFQANEKYRQAIGAVLPTITGTGSYFEQQPNAGGSISSAIQKKAYFTATQPIFVGGRDWAAFRQTKLLIDAQEGTKKQNLVQLFQATTQAFYQVLSAEKDIYNLQSELKLYDKQIAQLEAWVKIGRSRPADVTQTQTPQAQLLATEVQSRDQLQVARETLAYLTGFPNTVPLKDPFPYDFEVSMASLDQYVAVVEHRPEVQSAAKKRDAADEGIWIAKGAHLPTVGAVGDYYAARTGGIPGGNWDFSLTLSLPIFSGGTTQSLVRVAASQYRENELLTSQSERLADQEIRTYYQKVLDDHAQVKALQTAKDIAWTNYQQESHDYHLGLVTNLDLLQSLTTFTTTERSLDQTKFQEKIDYLYLQAASGKAKDVAY